MKTLTLDPVLELRDAVSLMMSSEERSALLDEHGRIAVINAAWREAAQRSHLSAAVYGRGADYLALCDRAAADGQLDAGELAAAVRRVMRRELDYVRVALDAGSLQSEADTCFGAVRRVRGPLENWFQVSYSNAQKEVSQPTALPELGRTLPAGRTRAEVERELDTVASHAALLDTAGRIVAVNKAWREFARAQGASTRATGPGANYLEVCERALRAGDRRGAQFADGLRSVLAGHRHSYWLDARVQVEDETRLFRGRAARIDAVDGPLFLVLHTDMSRPNVLAAAA